MSKGRYAVKRERSQKWSLYIYDVWGNAKEGYMVNDRIREGQVYLPPDASNDEVISCLIEDGYIKKRIKRSLIRIDGDDSYITIDYKSRPEMELVKEGR